MKDRATVFLYAGIFSLISVFSGRPNEVYPLFLLAFTVFAMDILLDSLDKFLDNK